MKKLKIDSKDAALTAVFGALYVIINILQMISIGNPTVYGPIQLRIADCLIALTILLGWPVAAGVTIGCFLTNAYYFIGAYDVLLGPLANLIAASIILILRRNRLAACLIGALPVGLIVGSYLWVFFPPPDVLNTLPAWAAMIASITISSLITIGIIGYLLVTVISRSNIIESLKSQGLKVADDKQTALT